MNYKIALTAFTGLALNLLMGMNAFASCSSDLYACRQSCERVNNVNCNDGCNFNFNQCWNTIYIPLCSPVL